MVVSISLTIPKHRVGVCEWLLKQTPDMVADILELTETVYNMNKLRVIQIADTSHYTECIHNWEEKYKHTLLKHQKEMNDIVENTRLNCGKEHDNMIQVLKQRNTELIEQSKRDKEYHDRQIEYMKKAKDDEVKHLTKMFDDSERERSKLQLSVTDLTKLFTGSASNTGIVGEKLVHYTFNTLQLGMLDDMRYDNTPGCEDFLWTHNDIICSVEVKNSKCLNSKHDIEKHYRRIEEAVQTSKINCGLFLSLNARVPNMSTFEIQTYFGIPILYVSKQEGLSHQTMIELSFRLMNIIWQTHQSQKGDCEIQKYNSIFNDISSTFSLQINNIASIDDTIQSVEKNIQQIFVQIQKLKKNKTDMFASINTFYDKYPITKPVFSTNDPTEQMSQSQRVLIMAVVDFNARRKKYPKSVQQVKNYLSNPDDVFELAKEFDKDFEGIIEYIKKNKKNLLLKSRES